MDVRAPEKFEMSNFYHEITDDTVGSADIKTQLPPRQLPSYRWKTWKNYTIFVVVFLIFVGCIFEQIFVWMVWLHYGFPKGLSTDLCHDYDSFSVLPMFGPLQFKTVKIIDAVINLVLGRGIQVLCGWISYRVVSMATLRITQEHRVPLSYLYSNTFDGYSVKAVLTQYRTLIYLKSWRARVIVAWLGLSILFLMLSPIMVDLTTGYIISRLPFINIPNDSGPSDLVKVPYVCIAWLANAYDSLCWNHDTDINTPCITNCTIAGYNLMLNDAITSDGHWKVNDTRKTPGNLLVCANQDDYYYGISFGYLQLFTTALLLWLCGTFGLWVDTIRFGYLWRTGRGWGPWRAILDISDHLRESLGDDHSSYCEHELEKYVAGLALVGHEVRSDGEYACVKLSTNPGGHSSLKTPRLVFGSESRLNQRRAMTTQT